jgi:hypothetical protein
MRKAGQPKESKQYIPTKSQLKSLKEMSKKDGLANDSIVLISDESDNEDDIEGDFIKMIHNSRKISKNKPAPEKHHPLFSWDE